MYTERFYTVKSDSHDIAVKETRPANFDEKKKYPVLLSVYGGPNTQKVSFVFLWENIVKNTLTQTAFSAIFPTVVERLRSADEKCSFIVIPCKKNYLLIILLQSWFHIHVNWSLALL